MDTSDITMPEMLSLLGQARKKIEDLQSTSDHKIAVVGMAGRLPGADDLEAFWELLATRRSGLRAVTPTDMETAGRAPSDMDAPGYVPVWGGPDGCDSFDAAFFGYAPRQAELMDPQQRLFLETAWHALDDAGYGAPRPDTCVGVYAGASLSSHILRAAGRADPFDAGLANIGGMVAARASFHLDLKGPSIGVQTTCSTALVAIDQAMDGLRRGACDVALAGAVAVHQARAEGYQYHADGIVSPDGACRPFDAAAQGTVFANGVGVVALKRLGDAQRDGDTIYGVLLGAGVNNDGADKVGLTAPSVSGQSAAITKALQSSGVTARDIDYIEAHGTGTALGDPIELTALNAAYGPGLAQAGRRCALGAVKGNTGHLDAAAGMAGLFKILLAFRHGHLPGTAHFETANPRCDFGAFDMIAEGRDWPHDPERPRCAGLSAFGIGGTNAHLIIEEPPRIAARVAPAAMQVLPLSAHTPEALDALRARLADMIETGAPDLQDVAMTLQDGRKPLKHRHVIVAHTAQEAISQLRSPSIVHATSMGPPPETVFVFSGQGSQRPGMARDLYAGLPMFRDALDGCLAHLLDADLVRRVLLDPDAPDAAQIHQTAVGQPALFAMEYALAQHWMGLGVVPQAMIGHSLGELTAAAVAGVFDLRDACAVVAARGALMQACAPGAMLAVMMSEQEARNSLPDGVEIAAVNGPRSVVLSGPHAALAELAQWFERSGLGCQVLPTSHAFHSATMTPAQAPFRDVLRGVHLNAPILPMMSNVTGDWLGAQDATDPSYWARHLREQVRFGEGIGQLGELTAPMLLEIGPGGGLIRLARQTLRDKGRGVASMPGGGVENGRAEILTATGDLWAAGVPLDWSALRHGDARRISLPPYPFERSPFWLSPTEATPDQAAPSDTPEDWVYQPVWSRVPVLAAGTGPDLVFGADHLQGPFGQDAILVSQNTTGDFQETPQGYALDPANPAHYAQLFAAVQARGVAVRDIAVAWGLGAQSSGLFDGTLALARALASTDLRPKITLLGTGMEDVTGSEALSPDAAMVLGLLPVLCQELPGVKTRAIDLDVHDLGDLVAALSLPWSTGQRFARRGGRLWALGHRQTPLPPATNMRAAGPILITGDLTEGLALAFARGLRTAWQAPLILVGRGLPNPQDWEDWYAANSADTPTGQMIAALRDMGEVGRDILVMPADISDADALGAAIAKAEAQLGAISGVIHTSAMGDAFHLPLAEADGKAIAHMIAHKKASLTALRAVISTRTPAFCLVQSSLSVLAGGHGFAGYVAANAWVDAACADANRAGGTVWRGVAWDMAETGSMGQSVHSMSKLRVLSGAEVWQISDAILAQPGLAQAVVCPSDLTTRLRMAMTPQTAPTPAHHTRTTAYIAPRDSYESAVAAAMSDLLGVADVGAEDNFFELGGHSLLAIQIINKLRRQYQIELPVRTLLYEAPTAAGIASVIRTSLEIAQTETDTLETLLDALDRTPTQETVG
ncbi:beta-ketoacyl synthase N-terminal-like domain-containing protein [Roseobacter sp.]|uniref:type I polyketide synthase n=1 Tax=Roseobacter sp. TaxID=1907202 RepID=UPI003297C7F2